MNTKEKLLNILAILFITMFFSTLCWYALDGFWRYFTVFGLIILVLSIMSMGGSALQWGEWSTVSEDVYFLLTTPVIFIIIDINRQNIPLLIGLTVSSVGYCITDILHATIQVKSKIHNKMVSKPLVYMQWILILCSISVYVLIFLNYGFKGLWWQLLLAITIVLTIFFTTKKTVFFVACCFPLHTKLSRPFDVVLIILSLVLLFTACQSNAFSWIEVLLLFEIGYAVTDLIRWKKEENIKGISWLNMS